MAVACAQQRQTDHHTLFLCFHGLKMYTK
uniref:Uncharacterized protein n=1 Tax=Arundo donax TaxID=35708 RepID=A0A0A8ZP20_ARUDO